MNYQKILDEISHEVKTEFGKGNVADYIPALAKINPNKFGMFISCVDGSEYFIGDAYESFSIQSISKVFTLTLAIELEGDKIWERVGKEPSGNPFNSLVQLEYENGKPSNPFINAGALVITDIIKSHAKNANEYLLNFVREISANSKINYDAEVAASEKETGFRNAALVNFMKGCGNIKNNVDDVLDIYFHQCSLSMSCADVARAFLFLANRGVIPSTKNELINARQTKRINALMLTCGLYDAVGDFAYWVGLPGKSGVGGGIAAVIPKVMSICVWSPELNKAGNSVVGTKALELFTTKTAMSIF